MGNILFLLVKLTDNTEYYVANMEIDEHKKEGVALLQNYCLEYSIAEYDKEKDEWIIK